MDISLLFGNALHSGGPSKTRKRIHKGEQKDSSASEMADESESQDQTEDQEISSRSTEHGGDGGKL